MLPNVEYRLVEGQRIGSEPGPVVQLEASREFPDIGGGLAFRCPCGYRLIIVRKPPHKLIEFDGEGRPTIRDSIGAWPAPPEWPDKNWCHGWMTAGRFTLEGDAICPGAGGSRRRHGLQG